MTEHNNATILIIEDDKDIREVLDVLLSHEGYNVLQAEEGLSALEMIDDSVDLIILDIMMPGMSGIDVCREIRKSHNAPILFLTAKSSDSDKAEGLSPKQSLSRASPRLCAATRCTAANRLWTAMRLI